MTLTLAFRGGPRAAKVREPAKRPTPVKAVPGSARSRKVVRDAIVGITRPDIRRLARRGGVKRISVGIYDEARAALRKRLETILHACAAYVEYRDAKTVTATDVIRSLQRLGHPIYGFDPETREGLKGANLKIPPAP